MCTEAQIEANRANAQLSTGPKTEEGKAKSSKNSIKHGIFCKDLLLPGEDGEALRVLRNGLLLSYNPKNEAELVMVDRIIDASWRLQRIRSAEFAFFNRACQIEDEEDKTEKQKELNQAEIELNFSRHQIQKQPGSPIAQQEWERDTKRHENAVAALNTPVISAENTALTVALMFTEPKEQTMERFQRYSRRLENQMHQAINQLRVSRKEKIEPNEPSEYAKSMVQDQPVQDEPVKAQATVVAAPVAVPPLKYEPAPGKNLLSHENLMEVYRLKEQNRQIQEILRVTKPRK